MTQSRKQSDVVPLCQELVAKNALEITQALIEKALEGSYQHAKFLFDMAFSAAQKAAKGEDELPGPSLAEILLERLRELEEETEPEICAQA